MHLIFKKRIETWKRLKPLKPIKKLLRNGFAARCPCFLIQKHESWGNIDDFKFKWFYFDIFYQRTNYSKWFNNALKKQTHNIMMEYSFQVEDWWSSRLRGILSTNFCGIYSKEKPTKL